MSGTQLVRYETARQALAECVRVDEVKDIRDKSAAMKAYARQRDDKELEVWVSEIYERACIRIGQISRELETAQGQRTELSATSRTKSETLAEAGIPKRTAYDYEQLAGGKTEQGQRAAEAAVETYFARSRSDQTPATRDGLRGAIREALVETLGDPEPKKVVAFRAKPDPVANALTDLAGAIRTIAELPDTEAVGMQMEVLADTVQAELVDWYASNCACALSRLHRFMNELGRRNPNAA
jgi:hypothetical protein